MGNRLYRIIDFGAPFIDWTDEELKKKFDPKNCIEYAVRAHANAIRACATGWLGPEAYYQSAIVPKAPGLGDRDLFRELIDEARKNNLEVVAYVHVGCGGGEIAKQHPEWVARTSTGGFVQGYIGGKWINYCYNTPFKDWILSVVSEIAKNYDVDGFFVDGPYLGDKSYCYCSVCRKKFKEETRMEVPEKEDWGNPAWVKWIEFHSKVREEFCRDLVKIVKIVKPRCLVGFNVTGTKGDGESGERVVKYSDFVPDVWTGDSKYRLATGKPFQVWLEYVRTPFWGLTKSSIDMKIDMGHIVASGGSGCILIHDGHFLISDPRNLKTLSAFFKFIEKNEKYLTGVKPSYFAALLFSNQTAESYGRRDPGRYQFSYDGFYEALRKSHIQFNVVLDKDLEYEKLRKYRVLCLPNAACLSERQISAIEKYVNNGGGLIATHETSLYDEKGERKKDFGLAKVINAQFHSLNIVKDPWLYGYMKIVKDHPITKDLQGLPMPILDYLYVEPNEESGILSKILCLPHNSYFSPARETKYPGILINTFRKGRVVFFPFAFGKFYRDFGIVECRKILENAVRWSSRDGMPIKLEAPSSVTMYLFEQPNRRIIHLVNGTTDARGQSSYLNALHSIHVSVRVPKEKEVQEVISVSKGEKLRFRKVNNWVLFAIPQLEEYNLIVVEYR